VIGMRYSGQGLQSWSGLLGSPEYDAYESDFKALSLSLFGN
jgi:hypothetical protein